MNRHKFTPLLGYCKRPMFAKVFWREIVTVNCQNGTRATSLVRCVDSAPIGAKTRTIHTDAGRVKVPMFLMVGEPQ